MEIGEGAALVKEIMNIIKVYLVNTVKSIKSANCEKSVKFAEI